MACNLRVRVRADARMPRTTAPRPTGQRLWAATLKSIHDAGGVVLAILVGLHLLAALKHHFIDRDDTLRRMLRWRAS